MDLVTHGESCGIFIPPCDIVTHNNCIGYGWNKVDIGPQKCMIIYEDKQAAILMAKGKTYCMDPQY